MKLIKLFSWISLVLVCLQGQAQKKADDAKKQFQLYEDSLKALAPVILKGTDFSERKKADSLLTKMLVRALKQPHSFNYPFDSLITISRLYAPDSSFRMFTWQIMIDEEHFRHKGAIQMRTKDGMLQLFPLIDQSDFIKNPEDTVLTNESWWGSIYYKILCHVVKKDSFYTLIGFDENNSRTNKKIIEVLRFINGKPVFGGNYFLIKQLDLSLTPKRFIFEYKNGAGARLNYDPGISKIIVEHLVSESKDSDEKSSLVGDGDYDAFEWQHGKWFFKSEVFDKSMPSFQAPVPDPVKDDSKNPF